MRRHLFLSLLWLGAFSAPSLRAGDVNLCEILCRLYDKTPAWSKDRLGLGPGADFDPLVGGGGWDVSTKTLGLLFLTKAAPFCDPKDQPAALLKDWFKDRKRVVVKEEPPPKAQTEEEIEKIVSDLPPEERANFRKLLNDARTATTAPPSVGQIDVYGQAFYSVLLRHLSTDEAAIALLKKAGDRAVALVNEAKGKFKPSLASPHAESHVFASALLATPDSKSEAAKAAIAQLNDLVKGAIKLHDSPLAIPNDARLSDGGGGGTTAGASRAVVVHLALLLHDKAARQVHEKHLRMAVTKTLELAKTPRAMGLQNITSVLAYLGAAISLLAETPAGAAEEKKTFRELMAAQADTDGTYKPTKGQSTVPLDNPQYGLAMLAVLDATQDKCPVAKAAPTSGIVDATVRIATIKELEMLAKAKKSPTVVPTPGSH